jgi:hypothetical protein
MLANDAREADSHIAMTDWAVASSSQIARELHELLV